MYANVPSKDKYEGINYKIKAFNVAFFYMFT